MKKTIIFAFILVIGFFLGVCWGVDLKKMYKEIFVQQEEEIFPVIGRATPTAGIGSTVGFVIKDGDRFKIARYDNGSTFDNEGVQPRFLRRCKVSDKNIQYEPVWVREYK